MKKETKSEQRRRSSKRVGQNDLQLLEELGFRRDQSFPKRTALVRSFTMRQLDRLKMMFLRIDFRNNGLFSQRLKEGIHENKLESYAEGVHILLKERNA